LITGTEAAGDTEDRDAGVDPTGAAIEAFVGFDEFDAAEPFPACCADPPVE
jgi:hypothetical protein